MTPLVDLPRRIVLLDSTLNLCRRKRYWLASMSSVIVRFNAASDRRIPSILLIEYSHRGGCLAPNSRPIS